MPRLGTGSPFHHLGRTIGRSRFRRLARTIRRLIDLFLDFAIRIPRLYFWKTRFGTVDGIPYIASRSVQEGRHSIHLGDGCVLHPSSHLGAVAGGKIFVGKRTHIMPFAMVLTYGGDIRIGDDCSVNPFCLLYGHGGLTIGNKVRIATQTVVIPANHIFDDPSMPICEQGETRLGIVIEDDVWIGTGARILDGIRIGTGSVIAAGAVVTKSVEPFTVVAGVPAKVIKRRLSRSKVADTTYQQVILSEG